SFPIRLPAPRILRGPRSRPPRRRFPSRPWRRSPDEKRPWIAPRRPFFRRASGGTSSFPCAFTPPCPGAGPCRHTVGLPTNIGKLRRLARIEKRAKDLTYGAPRSVQADDRCLPAGGLLAE